MFFSPSVQLVLALRIVIQIKWTMDFQRTNTLIDTTMGTFNKQKQQLIHSLMWRKSVWCIYVQSCISMNIKNTPCEYIFVFSALNHVETIKLWNAELPLFYLIIRFIVCPR